QFALFTEASDQAPLHDVETVTEELFRGRVAKDDPLEPIEHEDTHPDPRKRIGYALAGEIRIDQPDSEAQRVFRVTPEPRQGRQFAIGEFRPASRALHADRNRYARVGGDLDRGEPSQSVRSQEVCVDRMSFYLQRADNVPIGDGTTQRAKAVLVAS